MENIKAKSWEIGDTFETAKGTGRIIDAHDGYVEVVVGDELRVYVPGYTRTEREGYTITEKGKKVLAELKRSNP